MTFSAGATGEICEESAMFGYETLLKPNNFIVAYACDHFGRCALLCFAVINVIKIHLVKDED